MAILVPVVDGWSDLAVEALAISTGIWGGSGNILVPYDPTSGEIDEAILELVRRFDPDVWGDYHHTLRWLEVADPPRFDALVSDHVRGHEQDEQWLDLVRRDLRQVVAFGGAPPTLVSSLVRLTSPAWDRRYGRPAYLATDTQPSHDTGLLVDAARLATLPERLFLMDLAALPSDQRLMVGGRFGVLNPQLRSKLEGRDVTVVDVAVSAAEERHVRALAWGGDGGGAWSLGNELAPYRSEYAPFAPYRVSEPGLSSYTALVPHAHEAPIPIVVGDSFNDFAYAHALDRDLGGAFWLPGRLLPEAGDDGSVVFELSRALQRIAYANSQRPIVVVSRSLPADALTDLADRLTMGPRHVTVAESGRVELPARRLCRLLDSQGIGYPSATAFIDEHGTMLNHALPGMPSVLTDPPTDMVWWSDVVHPTHMLPARWPLNERAVVGGGFNDPIVRVGSDGISFASQVRAFVAVGATLEQLLARPRLCFLDAPAIFRALAEEVDIDLVESDKGAYARLTVELWGDLQSLLTDLRPGPARVLLEAWQSGKPSGVAPGNRLADRRYLSMQDMADVLAAWSDSDDAMETGDHQEVSRFVQQFTDRMLDRGVLRRGQCLMCATCRHFGWYDADDVGQSFRCPRCRTMAIVSSRASKSGTQDIAWYYQLHEAVYQAFRHDFVVPMLAIARLTAGARSALWMSEHVACLPARQGAPAEKMEGDIWLVVDGKVILGEAKSNGVLGNQAQARETARRYARLSREFTADRVVFAAGTRWASGTEDLVAPAFKRHHLSPEFIDLAL